MTNGDKEPKRLIEEDLAAIDAAAPYEPGKGITAEEARRRAGKRIEA